MSESPEYVRPTTTGRHELQMSENLHLYDLHREDAIRDRHILYARSMIQRLDEGYTLEWVISTLVQEIPGKKLDVLSFIPLANHLLLESGRDLQIDLSLNITTINGDIIVASKDVVEDIEAGLATYLENKQSDDDAIHNMFAQKIAERLLKGFPVSVIMAIVKTDITAYEMDVKKISRTLNAILEESGSDIKFDAYLEPVYVISEALDD